MRISEGELKRLVLSSRAVTKEQLDIALQRNDLSLTEALVTLGYLSEEQIAKLYAKSLNKPYVSLRHRRIAPSTLTLLDQELAERYQAIVFEGGAITRMALTDPDDEFILSQISKTLDGPIEIFITSAGDITHALSQYRAASQPNTRKSAARSFQGLIERAIEANATVLHLEPQMHQVQVRHRIDGRLHIAPPLLPSLGAAITGHLKSLTNINPYQTHTPQTTDSSVTIAGQAIAINVSFSPTEYGEYVVIKLRNSYDHQRSLTELGLDADQLQIIVRSLHAGQGLTVIAGIEGSGINTTLTAIKKHLAVRDHTVSDWINTPAIAKTVIGARNQVVAPLHAADAATAISRLIGFTGDPLACAAGLKLVIAERLARKLCPHCRVSYTPTKDELSLLQQLARTRLYGPGAGCEHCRGIGYKGQTGIFEVLPITAHLQELIANYGTTEDLRRAATANGVQTLRDSALLAISHGITSFDEIRRLRII